MEKHTKLKDYLIGVEFQRFKVFEAIPEKGIIIDRISSDIQKYKILDCKF